MGNVDTKIVRYKHFEDRIYKKLKFEPYNEADIEDILSQITDLSFTPDAIKYLATRTNQFRKIVQTLDQLENKGCIKRNNEEILYLGKNTVSKSRIEKKDINLMFGYRTSEEKGIIIKGFCLEIPPQKLCELIIADKLCLPILRNFQKNDL